mgnify:CR=1 FL=1
MIDESVDHLLLAAKKKKKIPSIPTNPVGKIDAIKKVYKKEKIVMDTMELYELFRKIELLRKEREGEFRKNVTLRVHYKGKEIEINLLMLKDYRDLLEKFISYVKQVR